jgi:inositol polyphosphate-4-phosphatase
MATLAESLGYCKEQHRSNLDNLDKLKRYHIMNKKISSVELKNTDAMLNNMYLPNTGSKDVSKLLDKLEELLRSNDSKNVKALYIASEITR